MYSLNPGHIPHYTVSHLNNINVAAMDITFSSISNIEDDHIM